MRARDESPGGIRWYGACNSRTVVVCPECLSVDDDAMRVARIRGGCSHRREQSEQHRCYGQQDTTEEPQLHRTLSFFLNYRTRWLRHCYNNKTLRPSKTLER